MPDTPCDDAVKQQQQPLPRPSSLSGIPSPWAAVPSEVTAAQTTIAVDVSHQVPDEPDQALAADDSKTKCRTSIASFSLTHDKEVLKTYRRMAIKTRSRDIQMTYTKYLLEIAQLYDQGNSAAKVTTTGTQRRLLAEAGYWINRLAKSGHPEALFIQGRWHMYGPPTSSEQHKVQVQKAVRCFKEAAKAGWVDAHYEMAQYWKNRRAFGKAVASYQIAASKGHTLATYKLAKILLRGRWGQRKDVKQGMAYLQQAADVSDGTSAEPAFVLSCVYADEPDRSYQRPNRDSLMEHKDVALAIKYLSKASRHGLKDAIHRLGQIYEQGLLDQPRSPAQGLQYYTKAAEEGHVYAMLDLSRLYVQGIPGHLVCQPNLGFRWCQRAAEKGLAKAEYVLGTYYEDGVGVHPDYSRALEFFNKAASKDYLLAAEKLNQPNHDHPNQSKKKYPDECLEDDEVSIIPTERSRYCIIM
ncbi:hypothetical protein DFQ28_004725 [Apophysomyces sp. BC1034]|nr:hypothetical protein DFQ28_004725 [Apophysomyces sp. BC1034]